jgi:hypothetical protein
MTAVGFVGELLIRPFQKESADFMRIGTRVIIGIFLGSYIAGWILGIPDIPD